MPALTTLRVAAATALLFVNLTAARPHLAAVPGASHPKSKSSCIPVRTALAAHPHVARQFFALDTTPPFVFTVRSKEDAELYGRSVVTAADVGGFIEGVHLFLHDVLRGAPPGTFVDVGGNFGVTSMLAANLGHTVVAVEGSPDNAAVFKFNTLLNCLHGAVTLVESLVSDTEENLRFSLAPTSGASGAAKLAASEKAELPDGAMTTAAAKPLDTLLSPFFPHGARRPLAWKLDIERFELAAFRGATSVLTHAPPFYIVWEAGLDTLADCVSVLRAAGYTKFFYVGSMVDGLLDVPTAAVRSHWRAWAKRPLEVGDALYSAKAYHGDRVGSFDVVAVHADQGVGCTAGTRQC